MSFTFGAPAPGPPPSTGAFTFGTQTGAPNPPAPANSSFSFGTSSAGDGPPPSAFASGTTGSSSASSAQYFGSPVSAPGQSTFSFGGSSAPASQWGNSSLGGTSATASVPLQQSVLDIPMDDSPTQVYELWTKLKILTATSLQDSDRGRLAGQELVHLLQSEKKLATPAVASFELPKQDLRDKLTQIPLVKIAGKEVRLTAGALEDILGIANNLRLSEAQALSLYAQAKDPQIAHQILDEISGSISQVTASQIASQLYFRQHKLPLQSLLLLMQYRLSNGAEPYLLQATDILIQAGLIPNLIRYISDTTYRVNDLVQEVEQLESNRNISLTIIPSQQSKQKSCTQTHLDFWVDQRQRAAETLFFIAYHLQFKGEEVALLIDLIQNLSNNLRLWDPFNDIPSVYREHFGGAGKYPNIGTAVSSPSGWMITPEQANIKTEKNSLEWQSELIEDAFKSGQPHLLRCIGILVITFQSALESNEVLMDRVTHGPNEFGSGNALLPPGSTFATEINVFHERLSKGAAANWTRPDVLGILMPSYALLLRSGFTSLNSPHHEFASPSSQFDYRKTWRECLEAPTELKSFTFARLCLIPAIQKPFEHVGLDCDTHEFLMSVLSQSCAQYMEVLSLSGDRPISRAMWQQDAEEELELRRRHEDQHRQFYAWSGTRNVESEIVPAVVTPLDRPDCMEDIIALAVSLCRQGPTYAMQFWTTTADENAKDGLIPSRALRELELQKGENSTLEACYISFLSALALAADPSLSLSGADAINNMLKSQIDCGSAIDNRWLSYVSVLQYYARALNPETYGNVSSASKQTISHSSQRAYYYEGDNAMREQSSTMAPVDNVDEKNAKRSTRELGEQNTFNLMSHLNLLCNVAAASVAARLSILSVTLPLEESMDTSGQESTLMILFTLAMMPVSSEIRGAVFKTIAMLLRLDGASLDEQDKLKNAISDAWDILEICQILPIHMFEQFPSIQESEARNISRMNFPPSATVVSTISHHWLPSNPIYSIVYELEFIEANNGTYPCTEGFLTLLQSLFQFSGTKSNVGRDWRVRSGCTPYIEYVLDLVIPRATGLFSGMKALPFRTRQDKFRLLSAALGVVEIVTLRYNIPSKHKPNSNMAGVLTTTAVKHFGDTFFAKRVTSTVPVECLHESLNDFDSKGDICLHTAEDLPSVRLSENTNLLSKSSVSSLPRAVSPGITALSAILSSEGILFKALLSILVEQGDNDIAGEEADRRSLCFALFKAIPPTFESARNISKGRLNLVSYETLLICLAPATDPYCYSSAVKWRSFAMLLTLRLFGIAVDREDALISAVSSPSSIRSIVPVLQFKRKSDILARLQVIDFQPSKVFELLLAANTRTGVVTMLVRLVASPSFYNKFDVEISMAAVSILCYIDSNLIHGHTIASAYHDITMGKAAVAAAFGVCLFSSFRRSALEYEKDVASFILSQILKALRSKDNVTNSLPIIILGFAGDELEGNWTLSRKPRNCFDAIVQALDGSAFASIELCPVLVTSAFEVIYRLYALSNVSLAICVADRLSSIEFLKSNICHALDFFRYKGKMSWNGEEFHAAAWILKSVAYELQFLAGMIGGCPPRPIRLDQMLSVLLAPPFEVLVQCIQMIPIEKNVLSLNDHLFLINIVAGAKLPCLGAPEVVSGYELLDSKTLIQLATKEEDNVDNEDLYKICNDWNQSVINDCASAHVSKSIYIVLCSLSLLYENSSSPQKYLSFQNSLLEIILYRLTKASPTIDMRSMDVDYFTNGSRNLAMAALVVSDIFVNNAYDTSLSRSSVATFNNLALTIQAIVSSSQYDRTSVRLDSCRDERTVYFACVFQSLLKQMAEIDMINIDATKATISLARIACRMPSNSSSDSHFLVRIARSCLEAILGLLENNEQIFQAILSAEVNEKDKHTIAEAAACLVASLDPNIAELLTTFCLHLTSENIQVNANIFYNAMLSAADHYRSEVIKVSASLDMYREHDIAVPDFFPGHLQFLRSLLSIPCTDDKKREMAIFTLRIIKHYEVLGRRLIRRFPLDGDVLHSLCLCVSEATSILRFSNGHFVLLQNNMKANTDLETSMIHLAMHIAENPLPSALLPNLPAQLATNITYSNLSTVSFSTSNDKVWWERLKLSPIKPFGFDWTSAKSLEIFSYAKSATDFIMSGLLLMREEHNLEVINLQILCRALCRCVDAIKVINISFKDTPDFVSDIRTLAKQVSANLLNVVSDLLCVILQITDRFSVASLNKMQCELLVISLDYSQLEKAGSLATGLVFDVDNENHCDFTLELAKVLRNQLETIL